MILASGNGLGGGGMVANVGGCGPKPSGGGGLQQLPLTNRNYVSLTTVPCVPGSVLGSAVQSLLAVMSLASRFTGVSYYAGLQGSYTATGPAGVGFGGTGGGSVGFATDPQGNQAIVLSLNGAATIGTAGLGAGAQIGSATFQNVSGFSSYSFGKEVSGGKGLIVGAGYSKNSSGIFTYADVSGAVGKNADVSPSTMSYGFEIPICP